MMNTTLNQNKKAKFTPIILLRDYDNEEPFCLFCKSPFVFGHKYWKQVWEHLNNHDDDDRVENLGWVHWICNEEKKTNFDYQNIAHDKLIENMQWASPFNPMSEGESEGEKNPHTEQHTDEEELTDAEVGKVIDKLTQKFLDERLKAKDNPKPFLSRADTRSCIVFLAKKETNGRGSPQAVDRAIDTYCCSIGDYISLKEEGKRIIRIRKPGERIV